MTTQNLNKDIIIESFRKILSSLSQKEKTVIERRVGLNGERETLQHIWNSFQPNITRERVRQIEETGIKKIGRIIKASVLTQIQQKALSFINLHWWVLSRDKTINNIIKSLELEAETNKTILETIIHSDYDIIRSKQKLGCEIYFSLPEITKSDINSIHKEGLKILRKKKDVMDKKELFEMIQKNLKGQKEYSLVLIDSILDLFEDIVYGEESLVGLTKWKILNPKTLKDKAIYVMKKENTPMHFVDISNKITEYLEESVKVNTIHNELIRNNEFVLIWRGIYALKEWGFTPGTVLDVIVDILKKKGDAMTTEEITKEVLKTREVKDTTIYMNLQNKDIIERVWRNYYQLKK